MTIKVYLGQLLLLDPACNIISNLVQILTVTIFLVWKFLFLIHLFLIILLFFLISILLLLFISVFLWQLILWIHLRMNLLTTIKVALWVYGLVFRYDLSWFTGCMTFYASSWLSVLRWLLVLWLLVLWLVLWIFRNWWFILWHYTKRQFLWFFNNWVLFLWNY